MKEHIVISGIGRAGTTLLVEILTHLGYDTGFKVGGINEHKFDHCKAGLETSRFDSNMPTIIKAPLLCDVIDNFLEVGFNIKCFIIPTRNIQESAKSRINISLDYIKNDEKTQLNHVNGGMWGTADPNEQELFLLHKFHNLINGISKKNIPILFINFPLFVKDKEYCFEKLKVVFEDLNCEKFIEVFDKVVNVDLVHY